MTANSVRTQIEQELDRGRRAVKIGNFGLARVCGRRAAGLALLFWQQKHPEIAFGRSFMEALKSAAVAEELPEDVQETARRLATALNEANRHPVTLNPLEDARIIIRYVEKQVGERLLDET